jgi:tetratricopeptide (TPR) repeat protein
MLIAAQLGASPTVEQYLIKCVRSEHPDSPLILEAAAEGFRKTERNAQALHCLDQLLKLRPQNARAHYLMGLTLDQLAQPRAALLAYEKVVELDPEHLDARFRLAEDLVEYRRIPEARHQFEFLRERQPTSVGVLVGLATCLHIQNELSAAQEILESALSKEPDNVRALTEVGRIELESGAFDKAERSLRRALQNAPNDRRGIFSLYQCLEQAGKAVEAAECLARYKQIDADMRRLRILEQEAVTSPHNAALDCEAGILCLRNGMGEEGMRWFESALRKDPGHVGTHEALADYYERTGKKALAAKHRAAGK